MFDLALKKVLSDPDKIYVFGDTMKFQIIVYNQGGIPATNITVVDYVPAAADLTAFPNTGWSGLAGPIAEFVYTDTLAAETSDTICLTGIFQKATSKDDYVNIAEISRAEDELGNGTDGTGPNGGIVDADSKPDAIEGNDPGGNPTTDSDNSIDGNGLNGGGAPGDQDSDTDEDDSDPVQLGFVDMALMKTLKDPVTPIKVGDDVTFEITVTNQGTFGMTNIEVTDYIPSGFVLNDADWTSVDASTATFVITDTLAYLDEKKIDITMTVQPSAQASNTVNVAELSQFFYDFGVDATPDDVDSKGDNDRGNDPGGAIYTDSDNSVGGDGIGGMGSPGDTDADTDEDDADPAAPAILDLAIIKEIVNPMPVIPGDLVTFKITLFNQGNIAVTNVKIVDNFFAGFELADADWTSESASSASFMFTDTLERDSAFMVDITLRVLDGANADNLINVVEIEDVEGARGLLAGLSLNGDDIDSSPADDNGGDAPSIFTGDDDNPDSNSNLGESPDDSDPEAAPVFDLAMRKTLVTPGPAQIGDVLKFNLEVINQQNMDALGVEIVDYIPGGLGFVNDARNAGWILSGDKAKFQIADTIKSGTTDTVCIYLKVLPNAAPSNLVNVSEISQVEQGIDQDGNAFMNPKDVDSTPDDNNGDKGSEPYSELDDVVDESGREGGDEDDNDQAYPIICQSMACNARVNLVLDEDCNTSITASLLIRGDVYPDRFYDIQIRDERGQVHANKFDASDAGQRFSVSITNPSCGDAQCWGYVNVENKNVPKTRTSTTTGMCAGPALDFISLDDVRDYLAYGCALPVSDMVAETTESGDKCTGDLIIRTIRGTVTLEGKITKVILRIDTLITTPLSTGMVTCPGSMDLLDGKKIDCSDLDGAYPSPDVIAALMGERMAYPYVMKPDVVDSTLVTVKVNRDSMTQEKILLDGGIWALFDVIVKYQIDSSYYTYQTTSSWIPVKDGATCNLSTKYVDEVYESCVGEIGKIKRTWTILDWCYGTTKECVQWIIVTDETKPYLDLTQYVVYADVTPWICAAEIELSDYVRTKAGCTAVSVSYTTSAGVLNGSHLSSLWLAESPVTVTVTATNACGVQTSKRLQIHVADMTAPVAIAVDKLNVTLTGDPTGDGGIAKITAESIDAGSHDSGCGDVTTCVLLDEELQDPLLYEGYWSTIAGLTSSKGIIQTGSGTHLDIGGDLLYNVHGCYADGYIYTYELSKGGASQTGKIPYVVCKDFVKFCCGDLGTHKVALVVEDDSPYSKAGISWSYVTVEDKSAGKWYCVVETVPCAYIGGFEPAEKPRYGSDYCDQYEIREITRDSDVNTCGEGSIKIFWGAYDEDGNEVSTTECVYPLSGRKAFEPYEIKWPKHYTDEYHEGVSRECEVINDDGDKMIVEYEQGSISMGGSFECAVMEGTGGPVWCTEACGLIASSYVDEEIEAGDACKKIVRHWTIIDWCTWEANGSNVDDENDTYKDDFEAVDDTWLRVNEGIDDAFTDSREVSTGFVNGRRITDLECKECEKPHGSSDDIYFRYTNVDEDGYYTYDQVIKIIDKTAPEIDAPTHVVSIVTGATSKNDDFDDCEGSETVTASASDICGENTLVSGESLVWSITTRDEAGNVLAGPKQVIGEKAVMTTGVGHAGDLHIITWKVTDGCGNSATTTSEVIFRDDKNPTPVCIQDISTAAMSTDGSVVIWAEDFDRGSYDNCGEVKLAFLVDENGDLTDDLEIGNLVPSVTFDCDELTAGQSGTVFMSMYVIDDSGNIDYCNVRLRIDDNVDACPDSDLEAALIAGELRTEAGDMIEEAQVSLTNTAKTMMTPVDGNYAFANNALGSDYEVVPTKDGDYLNGVSTIDLVKIQRHILGLEGLDSPYKIIAADVSNDQRVSAIDLIHLRKILLGIDTKFSNNTSWRFVDADQIFSNIQQPWPFTEIIDIANLSNNRSSDDFVGVKIGDVSGNAIANSAVAAGSRSTRVLELTSTDRNVKQGEVVELVISSMEFDQIVGLQYTMDLEGLAYVGIESGAIAIADEHVASLDENTLTLAWNALGNTALVNTKLFTLYFEATKDVVLSESISISSRITESKGYELSSVSSGKAMSVTLTFSDEYSLSGEMVLMQNQPNPFRKATDVSFVLPTKGEATLSVFDVTGKLILERVGDYSKGQHTVTISKDELGVGSGVLYYQLESNEQVATKKMILVE